MDDALDALLASGDLSDSGCYGLAADEFPGGALQSAWAEGDGGPAAGPPVATAGAKDAIAPRDPLAFYIDELSRYPLLSAAREIELLRRLHSDIGLLMQLLGELGQPDILGSCMAAGADRDKLSPVSVDQAKLLQVCEQLPRAAGVKLSKTQKKVLLRLSGGIRSVREQVINANLRLVVHISKRYWTPLHQFSDLIQEGNLGLLRAIEKYDVHKGYRFSTYAYWWIQQRIFRYVSDSWRVIRLPANITDELRNWRRLTARKAQLAGGGLRPEDARQLDGLDKKYGGNPLVARQHTLSLDVSLGEDSETTLGQTIEARQRPAEDLVQRQALAKLAHQFLENLSPREQTVIRMRFGFGTIEACTRRQIAEQIDVSPERVRQIEQEALDKLKEIAASRYRGLSGFL